MNTSTRAALSVHGLENLSPEQQVSELKRLINELEVTERRYAPDNQEIPHPVVDQMNELLNELTSNTATNL